MKEYTWKNRVYILASCLFFLIVWQVLAVIINNDIYLPNIQQVITEMIKIISKNDFNLIFISSVYRSVLCYILAIILAIILGVLTFMYPFFKFLLAPINSFAKTIPTMVLVVLVLVWFNKDKTPFIVGFAITFPILYEGIVGSLNSIDKKIIDMMDIYEISLIEKIKNIYAPIIKFHLASIFVSTFSLAFKVVIAGEVHGQPRYGIGSAIQLEKVNFNTSGIFAWIVLIAILSLAFEFINNLFKTRIYRWKKNENRN
ncbi:ABC transporter permease subunit [Clostridium botulinum]|uniref:ABC transporter permease n=1 Tax=unclassified Clostridium TaxID=2614128 RepID=UPI0013F0C924|nr:MULTISPECIES: ABC transporter permease subunit [unclassified Clostridium]MBN1052786.1 ABC transporter permease subunit [Clostridium botulinum]MBN1055948.1 ABC transporter permease subunit [Clostridium botulinum]NFS28855.1 ABC transporter permease subunit [Clostridium botulinum]NFS53103.1 ABC transporter permease subunit [Clostridium botulinum]NFT17006.1 ABC transporter permease subunit [Clostridium botulinum]